MIPASIRRLLAGTCPLVVLVMGLVWGCGSEEDAPVKRIVVLGRLMSYQEPYVSEKLQEFARSRGIEVQLEQYHHLSDLAEILEAKRFESEDTTVALVKTHHSVFEPLVAAKLLRPLEDILGEGGTREILDEFVPESLDLVTHGGLHYGLPRKLESWNMLYRVSRVGDVYLGWEQHREAIDRILALENGTGLPEGYTLEPSLDDWDAFDEFVAAYIWRQTSYGMEKHGRITHRRSLEFGTFMDYAARLYALGADPETLIRGHGPAIEDLLVWEALFLKHDLYLTPPDADWVWKEFYQAVYQGDLFMFRFHSLDTFALHNRQFDFGGEPVFEAGDLKVALGPTGASLDLDEQGQPDRQGELRGVRTGWAWMIPATTTAPRLGIELARFLSGTQIHGEECARFGMLPVRKDVWENLDLLFPEEWQRETIRTAMEQYRQSRSVPSREATAGFLRRLVSAVTALAEEPTVRDRSRPLDRQAIRRLADRVAAADAP